jgi:putative DNA-invertase from lambdoid prophage Rac
LSTFSYIRVSTDKQDYENQKHGVLDFGNKRGLGKIEFIEETASGKTKIDKRELGKLIDRLQPGDVLIVSELSRLGRSMLEVMGLLQKLLEKEVSVYALKGDYELKDNISSKVLAFALSIAAEIERELISARTKEALSRKKSEGMTLGRPVGSLGKSKLDGQEEEIKMLLSHGVAKAAIARMMKVSRPALLDFIASRNIA